MRRNVDRLGAAAALAATLIGGCGGPEVAEEISNPCETVRADLNALMNPPVDHDVLTEAVLDEAAAYSEAHQRYSRAVGREEVAVRDANAMVNLLADDDPENDPILEQTTLAICQINYSDGVTGQARQELGAAVRDYILGMHAEVSEVRAMDDLTRVAALDAISNLATTCAYSVEADLTVANSEMGISAQAFRDMSAEAYNAARRLERIYTDACNPDLLTSLLNGEDCSDGCNDYWDPESFSEWMDQYIQICFTCTGVTAGGELPSIEVAFSDYDFELYGLSNTSVTGVPSDCVAETRALYEVQNRPEETPQDSTEVAPEETPTETSETTE